MHNMIHNMYYIFIYFLIVAENKYFIFIKLLTVFTVLKIFLINVVLKNNFDSKCLNLVVEILLTFLCTKY